ncbi:MAG: ABC transporter ATP-binding protein [Gammaproteobacteria bacterium]|nr:ABC transporter ATP-binding protein [Gammaproteobacteria bacterium]
MTLLKTNSLSVSIGTQTVCHQLELNINTGERWAILGMNGSGKTTLLHTLAGLREADSGDIMLNNTSISSLTRRQMAKQMGLLLQDYEDNFPGTVLQTVLAGRHPHMHNWQWESEADIQLAKDMLTKLGLEEFSDRQITSLSGGERRRVAIAMLLTQSPELFLMDEPSNHLDIRHQHQILQLFSNLTTQDNRTLLMVLHDINLAMRYCDHALLLFGNGETLAGEVTQVMTKENLQHLYQYPLELVEGPNGPIFTAV